MEDEKPIEKMSLRKGALRFAEQMPYLRYLGMGAWWAWIWLCYSSTNLYAMWPDGPKVGYIGLMYLYSTPAIALMCALAAVAWRKATPLLFRRPLVVAFGAIATIGTAVVAFSPWLGGDAGFAVGGVLTGVGTSALCLKTGSVYGTLGRREVLTAGCVSLIMAALVYFMGVGLPGFCSPVFTALLPLVSAFLYIMPSDDPFSAEDLMAVREREYAGTRVFVCVVIASVMIAATAGFAKGLVSATGTVEAFSVMGPMTVFGIFLGASAICFFVNCGEPVRMTQVCYAALIFLGVVVVALSGFGANLGYLTIGKELLWMIFTCLMAYMVFRFDFSPVRAFGLGQATYFVASALAWWFGMLMADTLSGDSARMAVMAIMMVAIVLVFAFVLSVSDIKFILTWRHDAASDAQPEVVGEVEYADDADEYEPPRELTLHERVELIDPRFGVSAREREILELFASGRSANWIAEELVISKNTVRSHIRSIYTKLDVHTRQELLDFLKTVS